MSRRASRLGLAFACGATLVVAGSAHAYFEEVAVDARGVAMGGAVSAQLVGASAYHWNPATLAAIGRLEALADYGRPYGVPDLEASGLALASSWRGTGLAVAWHRLGVRSAYSEDLFALAAGRALPFSPGGHRFEAGATFKLGRIGLVPFEDPDTGAPIDYGAQSKGSLDLGVRWITPWRLNVGWVSRDLLEPRYELIAGSGGGQLSRTQEISAAYLWNAQSTLVAGWRETDGSGHARLNLGLEVWFYDVFALRSGFTNAWSVADATTELGTSDFDFTGGVGLRHHAIEVDGAVTTHPLLGASYRASLTWRRERRP
jgi:hypothetical protein